MSSVAFDNNTGILWVLGFTDISLGEPGTPDNTALLRGRILDLDENQIWPVLPTGPVLFTQMGAAVAVTIDGITYDDGNHKLQTPADVAWVLSDDGSIEDHCFEVTETTLGYEHFEILTVQSRTD